MQTTSPVRKSVIVSSVVLLAQLVFAAVSGDTNGAPVNHPIIEELTNCTPAAVEQFPKPLLDLEHRRNGWLTVHIIIAIYMFVSLATLCEDYFVPAIEVLTESLEIDPDVAGATFMAAASSVPAIAASIIAILVAKGDLGVSTALGSAVLNAAGVVSVSALFAGKVVTLHRWPMYRDSFFFLISVAIMLVAMLDDVITWYEATALVFMYFVYAVFMSFDATLEKFFVENFKFLQDRVDYPEGMFPAQAQVEDTSVPIPTTISTKEFDPSPPGFKATEKRVSISPYRKSIVELPPAVRAILEGQKRRMSLISLKRSSVVNEQIIADANMKSQVMAAVAGTRISKTIIILPSNINVHFCILSSLFCNCLIQFRRTVSASSRSPSLGSVDVVHGATLRPPKNHALKVFWLLYLPFTVLFYFTIPDCQKKGRRKYFVFTFIMSTLYISFVSYLLVWMITIIGFTLNISDTVMGLTFLAIGVTLPDIVSSLLVVRKGLGDMAVCNALGSNIFEILVGLGLPWLIKTSIMQPGVPIVVESKGMMYSTISLLATLVFLIVLTHWNRWRMNKVYGAILMAWYMVFLVLSSLYELGFFGEIKLPTCASTF